MNRNGPRPQGPDSAYLVASYPTIICAKVIIRRRSFAILQDPGSLNVASVCLPAYAGSIIST